MREISYQALVIPAKAGGKGRLRSSNFRYFGPSERLEKIGKEFNLTNYSSVSNAISRVKRRLRSNKFKKRYGQILASL